MSDAAGKPHLIAGFGQQCGKFFGAGGGERSEGGGDRRRGCSGIPWRSVFQPTLHELDNVCGCEAAIGHVALQSGAADLFEEGGDGWLHLSRGHGFCGRNLHADLGGIATSKRAHTGEQFVAEDSE